MRTIDEARQIAAQRSVPEPNTGCMLWLGAVSGAGYAVAYPKGAGRKGGHDYVGRAMLGLKRGDPLQALHTCDTPLCVNADHLFIGTQKDNIRDMIQKGRQHKQGFDTHCKRGHEFTPENTKRQPGGRMCRTCVRESYRRYREHNRQDLNAKQRERSRRSHHGPG